MVREMKDSGVMWIGEIPGHWTCSKQKYLITLLNGRAYKDNEFEEDGKYKILRVGNLFTNPIWYTSSLELEPNKYCQDGDLLYSWSMSYAPVIWHGEKVIYHYHIWKTILSERINKMFAYYYLISLTNALRAEVHETTMGFITMGVMNNSSIALPPFSEQQAIVDFLDNKCIEIDGLLADLDSEVKTLAEYKKSIITETVTHGLNSDAPMRLSGIPWAETVPAHWTTEKGKYHFELRRTKGNPHNLELMSPTQKFGVIPQSQLEGVVLVKEKTDLNTFRTIRPGDFCISLRSFQGGFEYSKYEGVVSPAYQVFYPIKPIVDGYFKYMFKSDGFISYINTFSMSLRDGKNIPFEDFGNSYIPIPPIDEQETIAAYLDEKCAIIEQSIADKQTQIETLKSYKASLIYEYVTGKKQVI